MESQHLRLQFVKMFGLVSMLQNMNSVKTSILVYFVLKVETYRILGRWVQIYKMDLFVI